MNRLNLEEKKTISISSSENENTTKALLVDELKKQDRFLMPLHDFIVNGIHQIDENNYISTASFPANFDRPHLAGLNFEKLGLEIIKDINKHHGLEREFSKNLLYKSSIICREEIKENDAIRISFQKKKELVRNNQCRQVWEYVLNDGAMKGECSVVYKN